jgi:hypothetical protein
LNFVNEKSLKGHHQFYARVDETPSMWVEMVIKYSVKMT